MFTNRNKIKIWLHLFLIHGEKLFLLIIANLWCSAMTKYNLITELQYFGMKTD